MSDLPCLLKAGFHFPFFATSRNARNAKLLRISCVKFYAGAYATHETFYTSIILRDILYIFSTCPREKDEKWFYKQFYQCRTTLHVSSTRPSGTNCIGYPYSQVFKLAKASRQRRWATGIYPFMTVYLISFTFISSSSSMPGLENRGFGGTF